MKRQFNNKRKQNLHCHIKGSELRKLKIMELITKILIWWINRGRVWKIVITPMTLLSWKKMNLNKLPIPQIINFLLNKKQPAFLKSFNNRKKWTYSNQLYRNHQLKMKKVLPLIRMGKLRTRRRKRILILNQTLTLNLLRLNNMNNLKITKKTRLALMTL